MPSFTEYGVEVDVDVDITVDEFVSECSSREIKELITALVEDGHLKPSAAKGGVPTNLTAKQLEFVEMLDVLFENYYSMSNEECELIEQLYRKYK